MTYFIVVVIASLAVAAPFFSACTATPAAVTSYSEYLSIVEERLRLSKVEAQASDLRRTQQGHCNLFRFNTSVDDGAGCIAYVTMLGCAGRCYTEEIPRYYMSRYIVTSIKSKGNVLRKAGNCLTLDGTSRETTARLQPTS